MTKDALRFGLAAFDGLSHKRESDRFVLLGRNVFHDQDRTEIIRKQRVDLAKQFRCGQSVLLDSDAIIEMRGEPFARERVIALRAQPKQPYGFLGIWLAVYPLG
ncbi:hypothetical protein [Methylosinus sp. H3A]|uniref:hypothetical protein n=1 Tax=Methylosinus sp. H3A TaxID=2785786 RepID=UPI001FEF051E|nr:hypothetical protein [Methylosinus sp. H3A]